MTRPEAVTMARKMVDGDEAGEIILPVSDHSLIRLAVACAQRWQRATVGFGRSIAVAFDLPAVDVAARWLGITPDARLLDGLTILEREALKLMRTES
ncbi:hypothetical protein [Paracoccus sp. (in: a-proteobacteria)]|uniref:hypothetical protein n=1 Tax=Paracoccus sp. TaxID=267 RepID=UPI0028B1D802|nr:hypothetical protein [Paracoccus sp. (in: a-proteobacteria)]